MKAIATAASSNEKVRAHAELKRLLEHGVLGFHTHFEATEIIGFKDKKPPVNVFSIFVAEERGQSVPPPKKFLCSPIELKSLYIEPGSPWENGYCESLNSKLRDELLNGEIFTTLREAQVLIESWRRHYNPVSQRPSLYVFEGNRFC